MSKKHRHKNKCYCDYDNSNSIWNYNFFILLGLVMLLSDTIECITDTIKTEEPFLDIHIEDKSEKNDKCESDIDVFNEGIPNENISQECDLKKEILKDNYSKECIGNEKSLNEEILEECINDDNNSNSVVDIQPSSMNDENMEEMSPSSVNDDDNIDTIVDIPSSSMSDDNNINTVEDMPLSSVNYNLQEKEKFCEKVIQDTSEKKSSILFSKSTVYGTTSYQCNYNQGIEHYLAIKPSVADIPVVLSKFKIEVFIEAIINFPEPVFEVKSLDKRVILEECELINRTDKIFIKGLLQEDIECSTVNCIKTDRISGDIKKLKISIPFQCSTKVHFSNNPQLPKVHKIEIKILQANKNYENITEKNYGYLEFPRDKVFCDLDSTEMLEANNKELMKLIKNTLVNTYSFERIRKKVILTLGLSLLQNQSTVIYNSPFNNAEEIEKAEKKVDTYMDNDNDIKK